MNSGKKGENHPIPPHKNLNNIIPSFPNGIKLLERNFNLYKNKLLLIEADSILISEFLTEEGKTKEEIQIALDLYYLQVGLDDLQKRFNWVKNALYKLRNPRAARQKELELEVIRQVPIAKVADYSGIKLKKDFALCPFHSEKTPSFKIYQETNTYYCFGCHETGDVIQFVMKLNNLNFKEALKELNTYE